MLKLISHSDEETRDLGARLARCCRRGDIIGLIGDLGSGKTTLVKGFAEGMKVAEGEVSSPTFVLMNVYEGRLPVFHFDLYRIADPREILQLDYEEYLYGDGVALIEWAERMGELLPDDYLRVDLAFRSQKERAVRIEAQGKRSRALLERLGS